MRNKIRPKTKVYSTRMKIRPKTKVSSIRKKISLNSYEEEH